MVVFKLMIWTWKLDKIIRGGQVRPIAPAEDVLARQPEPEPSS
jgi:hypothetical protein